MMDRTMAMDCLILHAPCRNPRRDQSHGFLHVDRIRDRGGRDGYIYYRARRGTKKDPLENRRMSSSMAQHAAVERQMSNLLVELRDGPDRQRGTGHAGGQA